MPVRTLVTYLNKAKKKTGSDYATAKAMKTPRQTISRARRTKRMSNALVIALAGIVNVPAIDIIQVVEMQKVQQVKPRRELA